MKRLRITVEGKVYDVTVEELGDAASALPAHAAPAIAPPAPTASAPQLAVGGLGEPIVSQLAGAVVGIEVTAGQVVIEGQALVVLEAMKMNTTVVAPKSGTVESVAVEVGNSVEEGQTLLTLSS